MAAFDLNAQFENISEKASAASERIQLAADETRDPLAADAAIAQASEAADRLKNKAETEARHDIRALARNSGPVALAGSAADCATVRRSTTDICLRPRRRACSHRQRQVRRVAHANIQIASPSSDDRGVVPRDGPNTPSRQSTRPSKPHPMSVPSRG
jgi:hypothetical protein